MQTSSYLTTLDHLWAEDASAEAVAQHFKALPSSLDLTDWFQDKARGNRVKAQLYLRTARACVSYRTAPAAKRQLLFAWPVAVTAAPAAAGWKWARGEAQNGLSLELADIDAQVQMCAEPVSCEAFQNLSLGFLAECVEALATRRDPLRDFYPVVTGPGLWVGLVTVPEECAAELEQVLFVVGAEVARMTKSLAMRMEALVEEEGGVVRVFPPTAVWNAGGLARLAHARLQLAPAKKAKGPWVVRRRGTAVCVSGPSGDVFVSEFPEETNEDLAPLFTGWAQTPELHLNELQ